MLCSPASASCPLSSSAGRLGTGDRSLQNDASGDSPVRLFSQTKRNRHRRTDEASASADVDVRREGLRKEPRIIGGRFSDKGEYPYAVSLKARGGRHFCGGSLIARDAVLSAAHCANGKYDVVIGKHRLNSWFEGETISVKAAVPHPAYRSSGTDNDFHLIFLSRPARADVELVRLNSDSNLPKPGASVTVMGWGDTNASEKYSQLSNTLKEVEVNVVSTEDCRQSKGVVQGRYTSYARSITSNMLCAQADGRDSCQGDSGGPLVMKGADGNQDVQVGVVSWGMGCADSVFPGVYARVSSAYSWIKGEVCRRSSDPPLSFGCAAADEDVANDDEISTTCGTAASKQANYRGTLSTTASGKTCQVWSSQTPHAHTRSKAAYPNGGLGNHNYCRNPDNNDRAWCYTTDPKSRWEFCNVPDCTAANAPATTTAATAPATTAAPTATIAATTPATTAAPTATPVATTPVMAGDGPVLPNDDSDDNGGILEGIASWTCSVFSIFC